MDIRDVDTEIRVEPIKNGEPIDGIITKHHAYDLDIAEMYITAMRKIENNGHRKVKQLYKKHLAMLLDAINKYCVQHDINYVHHITFGGLVVPFNCENFLGFSLILGDRHKIYPFLSHHFEEQKNKKKFFRFVKQKSYPFFFKNCPVIDKYERMSNIGEWFLDYEEIVSR